MTDWQFDVSCLYDGYNDDEVSGLYIFLSRIIIIL